MCCALRLRRIPACTAPEPVYGRHDTVKAAPRHCIDWLAGEGVGRGVGNGRILLGGLLQCHRWSRVLWLVCEPLVVIAGAAGCGGPASVSATRCE